MGQWLEFRASLESLAALQEELEEKLWDRGWGSDPTIEHLLEEMREQVTRDLARDRSLRKDATNMVDDFTKKPWSKAPDVAGAFERARKLPEKEAEKPEAKLEYNPPGPSPTMGEGQRAVDRRVRRTLRSITESPGDRKCQEEYRAATRKAREEREEEKSRFQDATQVRTEESRQEKLRLAMRMRREFLRAARDGLER